MSLLRFIAEKAGRPEAVPYRWLFMQVTRKFGNTGKWRVAGIFGAWQNAKRKLKSDKVCRNGFSITCCMITMT